MALTIDQVNKIIALKAKEHGHTVSPSMVYILGIRGSDGHDDIGVFDDMVYVSYDWSLKGQWKFNTNPSHQADHMATLKTGWWWYMLGKHHMGDPPPKGRPGLIQADKVTVHRWNEGDDTGFFGVNFHNTLNDDSTSSLACQTFQSKAWANSATTGFLDVILRLQKVTRAQIMANPAGIGKKMAYILLIGDEANKLIAS